MSGFQRRQRPDLRFVLLIWCTKRADIVGDYQQKRITRSYEITTPRELQRELRLLLDSAYRNGVPIGPVSTWVCRNEDGPDREVVITRLATDEEIEREGENGRLITR